MRQFITRIIEAFRRPNAGSALPLESRHPVVPGRHNYTLDDVAIRQICPRLDAPIEFDAPAVARINDTRDAESKRGIIVRKQDPRWEYDVTEKNYLIEKRRDSPSTKEKPC